MKTSKKTLSNLKKEIYKNAFRLFMDACLLFNNKSFPSSYALAILSYEELGKLEMVAHICDDISINPQREPEDFIKHLFSRTMFFSHKNKQAWATDFWNDKSKKRRSDIQAGILDKEKQKAIYVGFNKRIQSPFKISSKKAYSELKIVFDKLISIDDLGFNGFDCWSDKESKKSANIYITRVNQVFSKIKPS